MSGRDVDPAQGAGQASTSQGRSFDAGPSAWIAAFEAAGYRSGPEGPHPSALLDPRGDRRGAEAAYRLWLAAEPGNERALRGLVYLLQLLGRPAEGAGLRLRLAELEVKRRAIPEAARASSVAFLEACSGDRRAPAQPPQPWVENLFDDYAPRFEEHLTASLDYRGPQELLRVLAGVRADACRGNVLDLGCGTGLLGSALQSQGVLPRRLDGVDLSQGMLDEAARTGAYHSLTRSDAARALHARSDSEDLVVAADMLIYLGDLSDLFEAALLALRPSGLFAFTVEVVDGTDWKLRSTGRYAHPLAYVRRLAGATGFTVEAEEAVKLRKQNGLPVPAVGFVLGRR